MKIFDIALLKIKMILKDKASLAWMILAPIIFITVVVYGFDGIDNKCGLVIVDKDNSVESKQFIDLMKENKEYVISSKKSDEAKRDLVDGKCIAILTIPERFSELVKDEESSKKILISKLRDNERIRAIQNIIENNFFKLQIMNKVGDKAVETLGAVIPVLTKEESNNIKENVEKEYKNLSNTGKIQVKVSDTSREGSKTVSDTSYTTIGVMIMFILFFVVTSAGSLIDEKKNGTWTRIRGTSTSNVKIILGYTLSLVITGMLQVLLLYFVGKYMYGVKWGQSVGALALLLLTYVLCSSTLGILIANICSNRKQLTSLIAIVVMPTSLLGGCMWSKEMMSDTLVNISYFTPQSWVIDGVVEVIQRNSMLGNITMPIIMLLVFSIIFFLMNLLVAYKRTI